MRPNQQNNKNRSRGRNGGRKHVNPLSRTYESNGPDVKVRGNASHIAEKYVQLARDAQASGDSVMAENYFQHAEHYFRIVMASQPQGMPSPQFGADSDDDDFGDDTQDFTGRQDQPVRDDGQREQGPRDAVEAQGEDQAAAREDRQPRADRPRRERRPRRDQPAGETTVAAAAEAEPAPVSEQPAETPAAPEGEDAPAKPRRARRTRRIANGEDPAGAPQPDVGELPAFLTGNTTAAE